jgi:two-component system cell cycle sensor histidine kinase PleC
MTGKALGPELKKALAKLQAERESMSWPERRTVAKAASQALESGEHVDTALALAHLLAEDAKWEVRKDVADLLPLAPGEHFAKLAAKLAGDSNAFVRNSVERALSRRRNGERENQRKRRGLDQVQTQYKAIEDVHGALAAEKARRMAERLYDVLVGETLHEMGRIMTPLKADVSALLGRAAAADPERPTLAKVRERVAFLERLMDDMRAYSHPAAVERRRERLADVISEAQAAVLEGFKAKGREVGAVALEIRVPENLTAEIARHQIVVAVGNVLKNAFEAFDADADTSKAKRISIEARPAGESEVELVVHDNGPGMVEEDLRDIRDFVPGRTSKSHGTGFGLPLARRYVAAHGGTLAIESTAGAGTTVVIALPVEQEEDA